MQNKKKLYFLGVCFCLVACVNFENPLISQYGGRDVLLPNQFDYSVRIQDDIYQFVNGRWLEFHSNEAGRKSSGSVNDLVRRTKKQLLEILTELSQYQYQQDSNEFKLYLLYQKYLDEKNREAVQLNPLRPIFFRIDKIDNVQDLMIFLREMVQEGREIAFLKWIIAPSYEDSSIYRIYLLGPNLVLNEKYFYQILNQDQLTLGSYVDFISIVLRHLSIQNYHVLAPKIATLEQKMASYVTQNNNSLIFQNKYRKIYLSELSQFYPGLESIVHSIKADEGVFFARDISYFTQLENIIKDEDIRVLKAYLKFFYFVYYSSYLDQASYRLIFDFFQHRLSGENHPQSIQDRAVSFINRYLGEALGQLYVKRYFSESNKKKILDLAEHIKKSFKIRLQNNIWMSQKTKDMALKKLAALRVKIAYPEKWQNYHDLSLNNQLDLIQIVEQMDYRNYLHNQNKIGQKVDPEEWTINPQHTNAYYDILKNEVIYPVAILQPPFYHQNSDPAVLYGTLGALMAHEMTHGFDLEGSYYDEQGNYRYWWDPKDRQRFDQKARKLIAQYQRYKIIGTVTVNGVKTLNENIADLGGINIAYDALLDYLNRHNNIPKISGFSQQQRFFLAWASLFKEVESEWKLKNSYNVYTHAPNKVRAFAPMLNMNAFHELFQVKPQDKYYLAPEERIRIW